MPSLRVFLLGPPRFERDGVPLELGRRKNVALIAYLAAAGPGPGRQSHSRETLITLLWPELEPAHARANLRRNLSELKRSFLGERLVVGRETIALAPDTKPSAGPRGEPAEPSGQTLSIDVEQFRRLLAACEDHDHLQADFCPDCLSALTEAVALYQGDFLAGFTLAGSAAFDDWQFY